MVRMTVLYRSIPHMRLRVVLPLLTLLLGGVAIMMTWPFTASVRWLVALHLAASAVAGAIGLLQVWHSIRARVAHRRLGYGYGGAVCIGGTTAVALAWIARSDLWARSGLIMGSVVWVFITLLGVATVHRRRYRTHRWWMRLSVLVTVSFFVHPPLMRLATAAGRPASADWAFWLVPLLSVGIWRGVQIGRRVAHERAVRRAVLRWWGAWAWQRLVFAALGFVPIAALCAALLGIAPLHRTSAFIVLPGAGVAVGLGMALPAVGKRALDGWIAGLCATALYDMFRLAGVAAGLWHDFIPTIGHLALHDPGASALWGYAWRFALNGGAMAVTFAMLPPSCRSLRDGVIFGVSICLCLFATLLAAPQAQQLLFPLTPTTAMLALGGHCIYGASCAAVLRHLRARDRPFHPVTSHTLAARRHRRY